MDVKTGLEPLLKEVDMDLVGGRVRWLTDHTPYRIADSEDERKAAEYIGQQMADWGLEVTTEEFYAYNSHPISSSFTLILPEGDQKIDSLPYAHIKSTGKEEREFTLVYGGNGNYCDYEGLDPQGKIVLVEVSYAPPVPEKARIAKEVGAAGIICMNWGQDEPVICNRGLKAVWGNPTEETLEDMPEIIGIGVTRSDGLKLKKLCAERGSVQVRVSAVSDKRWSKVYQPKGILRGNGKRNEFILVASHLDAWKPGVTCNATGNAAALELCRILSKHKDQLDRDIWFVFWNGHEIAEAAGSTWFVDRYWSQLNEKCAAYINIDSTGLAEASLYEIKSSDELASFTYGNARAILADDIRMMGLPKIGDQSFFGIGIPAIAARMSYTQDYIKAGNGVTLGWWNHTKEDDLDKYSPENEEKDIKALLSLLWNFCRSGLLPYDLGKRFESARIKLREVDKVNEGRVDLQPLWEELDRTEKMVLELESIKDEMKEDGQICDYNRFALSASRKLINVFQTYADKYQQDSYGFSRLSHPVPLLADISRLAQLSPGTLEYGMVETQLIKNRNRIIDALYTVGELADLYKNKIVNCR